MAYDYRFFKGGAPLSVVDVPISDLLDECIEISRSTFLEHVPYEVFKSAKHTFDTRDALMHTEDWCIKYYGVEHEDGSITLFMVYVNEHNFFNAG